MEPSVGAASRAWYRAPLDVFRATAPRMILGELAHASGSVKATERDAWMAEVAALQSQLSGLRGAILLEFSIPRMGRRIDAVLLIGPVVFVLEFKVGAVEFLAAARDQVWDYALDLKNFHEASHRLPIAPILVATEMAAQPLRVPPRASDLVYEPVAVATSQIRDVILQRLAEVSGPEIDRGVA